MSFYKNKKVLVTGGTGLILCLSQNFNKKSESYSRIFRFKKRAPKIVNLLKLI